MKITGSRPKGSKYGPTDNAFADEVMAYGGRAQRRRCLRDLKREASKGNTEAFALLARLCGFTLK